MNRLRGSGIPSEVPVFVVGMPRSGTTLVEQIIASAPGVLGAGELPFFKRALAAKAKSLAYPDSALSWQKSELAAIGSSYVGALRRLSSSAERITDKLPGNFLYLGAIHLALPRAPIVHVRRDPLDTCFSCFTTLFKEDIAYTYDLGELGRYYRAYEKLMRHWLGVLPEHHVLEVQYEDLVSDFERQARRIVAHCGLKWDDACLSFHRTERPVATASVAQVRQPLYANSVARWLDYEEFLAPLFAALEIDSKVHAIRASAWRDAARAAGLPGGA
jgi:hypothetical protein